MALGALWFWHGGRAVALPGDRWDRLALVAGAALGAALGSRLLYLGQYHSALQGAAWSAWLGGKTLLGGLLGGVLGVECAKRLVGWPTATGDRFLLPDVIGIVLGRLGCQLATVADLTYGNATALPWAWDYGDGVPRHPVVLYEAGTVLLLYGAVRRYAPRCAPRAGDRFRAFMVGYCLLRIGIDFLKPPFGPAAAGALMPDRLAGLTAIQWAGLAGLAYYARDLRRWWRHG